MTIGGIDLHQQHLIFTLLSAILHMGNIKFEGAPHEEAKIKNPEGLCC